MLALAHKRCQAGCRPKLGSDSYVPCGPRSACLRYRRRHDIKPLRSAALPPQVRTTVDVQRLPGDQMRARFFVPARPPAAAQAGRRGL
jgi:hypothetical protein